MGAVAQFGQQAIGPANEQRHIIAIALPLFELFSQCARAQRRAALIKRHHFAALATSACNCGGEALRFGLHQLRGCFAATARLGFNGLAQQAQIGRKALGVVIKRGLRPIGHFLPNGNNG